MKEKSFSDLEWDIKSYFLLGGAMHDVAISAWGIKGYYDYPRPISVIRYLSEKGQSSYPDSINYNPNGIKLIDNYIELLVLKIHLWEIIMKILVKLNCTLGKVLLIIRSQKKREKGSGWILAEQWWPYQRPSFVTPLLQVMFQVTQLTQELHQ